MVQEFYLLYCMPLHVYELVFLIVQGEITVDFCSYVQSVRAFSTILPVCHYLGTSWSRRELNETKGVGGRVRKQQDMENTPRRGGGDSEWQAARKAGVLGWGKRGDQ